MNLSNDPSLLIRRCGATFHIVQKGSLTVHFSADQYANTGWAPPPL